MAVDMANTKFSDIDVAFMKPILGLENEYIDEDIFIQLLMNSAKQIIMDYRKQTIEELDEDQSVNIGYILIVHDAYMNRTTVDITKARDLLATSLGMGRVPNL